MSDNYDELKCLIDALYLDFDKFRNKKVKASGQRARNILLNCKKLCDVMRKEILNDLKNMPIKQRKAKKEAKKEAKEEVEEEVEEEAKEEEAKEESKEEVEEKPKKKRVRRANKKKVKNI